MYGQLPLRIPDIEMPPIALPGWLNGFAWLRTPRALKRELRVLGDLLGNRNMAMTYNLHYELSGLGCVAAAIPNEATGTYIAYRQLEWDVGFAPHFQFEPLKGNSEVRYTPGFVGALSGKTPSWHISMNYAPDSHIDINWMAQPVAWVIREALARGEGYAATRDWLLEQQVVRKAYVTLVGSHDACWINMDPRWSQVHMEVEYPETLVVGNDTDEIEFCSEEWEDVEGHGPFQAESADAWVLDKYAVQL
jgi:hypothetical protein